MQTIRIDDESELRTYEEEHAEEVFAVVDRNREYLREWLPWVDNTVSVENILDFIRQGLIQQANDDGFQAGIWYQGRFAGGIGYHYIDRLNRKTEIGYWLDASLQGKGLMTRACKVMISYAFHEYGLNRVEIHCASGNTRSRAIPERLGFTQEGVLREASWLYDHFVDSVVYAMLAREWLW
jgi:ribosomal-protein-serine acetyltransferase